MWSKRVRSWNPAATPSFWRAPGVTRISTGCVSRERTSLSLRSNRLNTHSSLMTGPLIGFPWRGCGSRLDRAQLCDELVGRGLQVPVVEQRDLVERDECTDLTLQRRRNWAARRLALIERDCRLGSSWTLGVRRIDRNLDPGPVLSLRDRDVPQRVGNAGHRRAQYRHRVELLL